MEKRYDKLTGESLYYKKHQSGLSIYIMPRKDYSSNYALFATRYGSVDSEFIVPGEDKITKVPDGIAHYLEHKMFDLPGRDAYLAKFSIACVELQAHFLRQDLNPKGEYRVSLITFP